MQSAAAAKQLTTVYSSTAGRRRVSTVSDVATSLLYAGGRYEHGVMPERQSTGYVVAGCRGERESGGEFTERLKGGVRADFDHKAHGVKGAKRLKPSAQPCAGFRIVADEKERCQARSFNHTRYYSTYSQTRRMHRQKLGFAVRSRR